MGISSTLGLSGGVIAEDGEVLVPLVSNLPTRYTHFGHAAVYPDQRSVPAGRKVQFAAATAAPSTPERSAPGAGNSPTPVGSPQAAGPSMEVDEGAAAPT
eukprot:13522315-Alexandrium_andersonii.AAC.1